MEYFDIEEVEKRNAHKSEIMHYCIGIVTHRISCLST